FAWNVSGRHWAVLDRKQGLTRLAGEYVEQAGLADACDRWPALHVEVRAAAGRVDVPAVVLSRLAMRWVLSEAETDDDQRVAEQVDAGALAAPVIGGRAADRQNHAPARQVDGRRESPHVRPGTTLPAIPPCFVERLALLRHRLE